MEALYNESGSLVVQYLYDSWGEIISVSDTSGRSIGTKNPFRYRGYYYDEESGLYYLRSRYYDPEVGRFVSADNVIDGTGESVQGYNMYAYCFNNPINQSDSADNWPSWATKVLIGVAVIAVAAAVKHRVTTGSWEGAGEAALEGGADGFMSGSITGAITGGAKSNVCFVAGTAVLTSVGYVVIEDICAGDKVWSENPETGEKGLKQVVRTFINETNELVHVYVNGEEIISTPEHPFYVPRKGWTEAVNLRAGDILIL